MQSAEVPWAAVSGCVWLVAIISSWNKKAVGSMNVFAMTALLKELMMQRHRKPFPGHQTGWAVVMIAVQNT